MVSRSAYASQKGIPPLLELKRISYGSITRNEDIVVALQLHAPRGIPITAGLRRYLIEIVVWIKLSATFVVTASHKTLAHHIRNGCILGIITQFHEEIKILSRNFHGKSTILCWITPGSWHRAQFPSAEGAWQRTSLSI